ncbi:hypothetical protein KW786_02790 [Candidatus Parcubacteria bacterium]|nr:hypothetical protein [Candidatus Parcubacteria bacterium]
MDFFKILPKTHTIKIWCWFILKIAIGFLAFVILVIMLAAVIPFHLSGSQCEVLDSIAASKDSINQPGISDYKRPEESTYLTFPEWYIVYSAEEYAHFIKDNPPSHFPYFSSVGQYWCGYRQVNAITKKAGLPFNPGNYLMLAVIGTSFSVEYEIKGVYENTIGRISEFSAFKEKTQEDIYAHKVAQEYADFLYEIPWYEFSFGSKFKGLWTETHFFGPHFARKLERKFNLSLEYSVKSVYGWLMRSADLAVYTPAASMIYLRVDHVPPPILKEEPRVKIIQQDNDSSEIILIPRFGQFTGVMKKLAAAQVHFIDIAGNGSIFLTVIAPRDWSVNIQQATPLFSMDILTDPQLKRVGLSVKVEGLDVAIESLKAQNIEIEHLYDY